MSEQNNELIEAAQEQLMRKRNQEVAMAHNAHNISHDELTRLRAIEAAARYVCEAHRWPIGHMGIGHETSPYIEALRASLEKP